jgi:hypothetical protein
VRPVSYMSKWRDLFDGTVSTMEYTDTSMGFDAVIVWAVTEVVEVSSTAGK